MDSGIVGGFVWDHSEIGKSGGSCAAYAQAIVTGIAKRT